MICVGCKKIINSGSEVYVDRKIPFGIARFNAHVECCKNKTALTGADEVMDQMHGRSKDRSV